MGAYNYKQTILVRGDIDFKTKGKLAVQVAHASLGAILMYKERGCTIYQQDGKGGAVPECVRYRFDFPIPVDAWLESDFAKIVLKAPDLASLLVIKEKTLAMGLPHCLIKDNGTTVFSEPTVTCLAIGPWHSDIVEELTKDFKLL